MSLKLSSLVETSTWTSKGIEGRYDFRVLFNGSWRRVRYSRSLGRLIKCLDDSSDRYISSHCQRPSWLTASAVVDDKLPYHPTDGTLMCMSVKPSSSASGEIISEEILWPSLLEKAVSCEIKNFFISN